MKVKLGRLVQGPDKSFIVHKENISFVPWHHHPEYELVLIIKGRGKRMVGDNIARFEKNDLVLLGTYTPHEWLCDAEYLNHPDGFQGEAIVVQFMFDFLGDKFFEMSENAELKKFIIESSRGYEFFGESKKTLMSVMQGMVNMNDCERLYSLLSIFRIFATTREFNILSSPVFNENSWINTNEPMHKALQFISQNFHKPIQIQDLLNLTNMSNTSFYSAFKKTYRMPFKDYLLHLRVGYACKLLIDSKQKISGIAYNSGFGNISNFNRQFRKIKGITPSQFLDQVGHLVVKE